MENLHSFRFLLSLSLWIKSKGDYLSIIYIVITILWIAWIKPHFQRDKFKKVMKSYWLNQLLAINYLITEKVGLTEISFICQNLDHSTTGKLRMNDFSPTNLSLEITPVALFCQLLCFCAVVPRMLRIWESFFYSKAFFTLHSFRTFGTTCFYQGIPGAGNSAMNIAGLPTEVRKTDPAHLFVWITQCSAKGICR